MTVSIDKGECVGCENCIPVCPIEAICMVDGKAVVDPDTCTDCRTCVDECPVEAIKADD